MYICTNEKKGYGVIDSTSYETLSYRNNALKVLKVQDVKATGWRGRAVNRCACACSTSISSSSTGSSSCSSCSGGSGGSGGSGSSGGSSRRRSSSRANRAVLSCVFRVQRRKPPQRNMSPIEVILLTDCTLYAE